MNSIRSKTLVSIIALIILAFLAGLIFCFTFAHSYYLRVKQKDMLNIYDSMSTSFDVPFHEDMVDRIERYQNPEYDDGEEYNDDEGSYQSSNPYYELDDSYQELVDLCDEKGITLLILDPSGRSVFCYGSEAILSDRLTQLTFDLNTDDNINVLQSNKYYTIQALLEDNSSDVEFLEMWGFLASGNSFIARSSFSGINNSINVALWFFLFVCVVILIIAGVIIYILSSSYSKALRRLVAVSGKLVNLEFEIAPANDNKQRKSVDEISELDANIFEISQKLENTVSQLKSSNLKLKNELKAKAELEEQRKKYISDVSHELKTPISLISGYAEGLREGIGGSVEDQNYYLDVIIDEAEKMGVMVKRISSLNKLEQGHGDVNLERFDVVEVINGYLNTMALSFEEKQVDIFFNNKDIIYVWSDEFFFEEVLMNFINNALNHVDEKKAISIKVEPQENHARVTVHNTGKNIPEEKINKIWAEFYKVDDARTREYGGSGLGLSIVKAIADTLDQKYGVYNTEDGVAFWIDVELDKVQVYGQVDLEKKSSIKLKDIPIWQTTTKLVNDTAERIAEANKEREQKRKDEQAHKKEEQAHKKEEQAHKKEEQAKIKEAKKAEKKQEKTDNKTELKKEK